MSPIGGAACTDMGDGGSQNSLLCGKSLHSGPQPHLVVYNSGGVVLNVKESCTSEEYRKCKGGGLYPGVHMGEAVRGGV